MAFYKRAQSEMHPAIEAELDQAKTLEARLRAIISAKLNYFAPNRRLLSAHTDPEHPLSPFSAETATIREQDVGSFDRAVKDSALKLPPSIAPYLGRLLWMYQMGLILSGYTTAAKASSARCSSTRRHCTCCWWRLSSRASRCSVRCIAWLASCWRLYTVTSRCPVRRAKFPA